MSATLNSNPPRVSVQSGTTQSISESSPFWRELEFNRFGVVAFLLVLMACIGGLAAAVAVGESDWKLMAVAVTTGTVEVLIISVVPLRWIVFSAAVAMAVDLIVFIL
jgi:hypothetical protein